MHGIVFYVRNDYVNRWYSEKERGIFNHFLIIF